MPSLKPYGEWTGHWGNYKGRPEHYLDYLTRVKRVYTIVGQIQNACFINMNKSTKFTSRSNVEYNPVTYLNECDDCGFTSTPRRVNYKYRISGYFCMGCSNKRHRIYRLECDALETRKITNKLGRLIKAKQKESDKKNMP